MILKPAHNLVHDIIKIKYVDEGYLPYYPYHMISDNEMCDAFLRLEQDKNRWGIPEGPYYYRGNFFLMYPLLDIQLNTERDDASDNYAYSNLVKAIHYHISRFKERASNRETLPDWVLTYMLGTVISVSNQPIEIHDVIVPLECDNEDDNFEGTQSVACYKTSKDWIRKVQVAFNCTGCPDYDNCEDRHVCGNPKTCTEVSLCNNSEQCHILQWAPITLEEEITEFQVHPDFIATQVPADVVEESIKIIYTSTKYQSSTVTHYRPHTIDPRPPCMFGEPHVVKAIRVNLLDPMEGLR